MYQHIYQISVYPWYHNTITLYTLNLQNIVRQLHLNKIGGERNFKSKLGRSTCIPTPAAACTTGFTVPTHVH